MENVRYVINKQTHIIHGLGCIILRRIKRKNLSNLIFVKDTDSTDKYEEYNTCKICKGINDADSCFETGGGI